MNPAPDRDAVIESAVEEAFSELLEKAVHYAKQHRPLNLAHAIDLEAAKAARGYDLTGGAKELVLEKTRLRMRTFLLVNLIRLLAGNGDDDRLSEALASAALVTISEGIFRGAPYGDEEFGRLSGLDAILADVASDDPDRQTRLLGRAHERIRVFQRVTTEETVG